MALTPENGWHLTPEGLALCEGQLKKALDMDLKEIGCGILSEEINRGKNDSVDAGLVLQVTKIRNVSAPKINEESTTAPRMLKVSLTDGKTTVHAIELSKVDGLSLSTPPGTKIKLLKTVTVSNGFLLFESGSVKVLGGKVESLFSKWEISQKLAQFTKLRSSRPQEGAEGGPPSWIPFGKKIVQEAKIDKDFKALGTDLASGVTGLNSKENAEFDSQRKDAILEASKTKTQKVFGAGSKDIKEAENPRKRRERNSEEKRENSVTEIATNSQEPSNRGGREDGGRRKGGRNNREDASGQTKPSQNVSLFSFLEEKLPLDAAESGKQKQTSTNPKPSETSKPFYEQQQQQRHAQGRRGGGSEKPDRNSAAEKSDRNRDSLGQGGDRRRRGGGRGGHQDGQAPRENGQTEIEDANSQFRRKGDRAEYRVSETWSSDRGGHDGDRGGRGNDRGNRGGDRGGRDGDRRGQDGDRRGQDGDRGGRDGDRGGRDGDRGGRDGDRRGGGRGGRGARGGGRGGGQEVNRIHREAENEDPTVVEESKNEARQGERERFPSNRASRGGRGERGGGGYDRSERGGGRGDHGERGGHDRGERGGRGGREYRGGGHGNDRDFGEWSNSTYHNSQRTRGQPHQDKQAPGHHDKHQQPAATSQQPQLHRESSNLASNMATLQITDHHQRHPQPPQQQQQQPQEFQQRQMQPTKPDFSQPPPISAPKSDQGHQQWGAAGPNHHFGRSAAPQDQGFGQKPVRPMWNNPQHVHWRKGDLGLARYWEDGKFYPVSLTAVTETTAVVLFKDYGNHEEVLLSDIIPNAPAQSQRGMGFIPTTPGLPPAFPHS